MPYGDYLTPSQSAIFIGEYHVDDAYSVEWSYKDSRSPLYNYFDDEVVTSSLGKKIVVGTLAINFRYPGYLSFAISEARGKQIESQDLKRSSESKNEFLAYYLDKMRSGTAAERMKLLLEAAIAGPQAMQTMSAIAYASQDKIVNIQDKSVPFKDVFDAQKPGLDVMPIDIWTHFGDLDQPHVAQKIEGVVFVGESQQIQAGASPSGGLSASGINILEVYSFWAKRVVKYKFNQATKPLFIDGSQKKPVTARPGRVIHNNPVDF